MKVSQTPKHLGQSFALGLVFVLASLGICLTIMINSGIWQ